jgi:UDP-glucuronate 4-epimerase
MTILLTGGAGFIGSNLAETLLKDGHEVHCLDNLDPFYDPVAKLLNLSWCREQANFHFYETDIRTTGAADLTFTFRKTSFDAIIHLAAKAGVRPSIENAHDYYQTNVMGTLNLLEFAKTNKIDRFIFASSSSVYGTNPRVPWSESDFDLKPISPYASSKLAAEDLGQVYRHLHNINFIALRLFTVFGPRQRPDLAIHRFYSQIIKGEPLNLFGDGKTRRDYTYVTDIVKGFYAALKYNGKESIFNIGSSRPVALLELVRTMEAVTGRTALINWMPEQPGDVKETFADTSKALAELGYKAELTLEKGVQNFVRWKEGQILTSH